MKPSALKNLLDGRRALVVVASPLEAEAMSSAAGWPRPAHGGAWRTARVAEHLDVVVCGVGKVNAAGATARLAGPEHAGVVSLGVAGALPGGGLGIGEVVVAAASVYADEGLETEEGFRDCAAMGFPLGPFGGSAVPGDAAWGNAGAIAAEGAGLAVRRGRIATVSTCSGTDARAAGVTARTGAIAEAMEGAAVLHVAARLGLPGVEVRVVSNTTGDRRKQVWDLAGALGALGRLAARL